MKIIGVIPARYQSSRFPGKPLADICGRPMIWWVCQQVKKVQGIQTVYVATDDDRVAQCCERWGLEYLMTSSQHKTSTQRVYEAAKAVTADYYVCINGDEPLIQPETIQAILPEKEPTRDFYVANLMTRIKDPVEAVDFTNIKVVTDDEGYALFMSRSPIPYPKASLDYSYYKHVGVLAYSIEALRFFDQTPKGFNEQIEDINELRFIEHGRKLKMIEVDCHTLSVDTPKDLEKVRLMVKEDLDRGILRL